MDFAHKFLRSLPERYDTIVTLLVRSDVKTTTPTQLLGEVLTHDMFKKPQDEVHGGTIDEKKKSVSFRYKVTRMKKRMIAKKNNRMKRWLSLLRGSIDS